jgi:uncharacterized protein YbjT (DUF2867 family)
MIVVTGATGNVGRHLVDELVQGGVEVCAVTRDPARARMPDGVRVARLADLSFRDVTGVFLNAAVMQGEEPGEFLDRAARHGVQRIVTLSSLSVLDVLDGGADPANAIGLMHRRLEAAIEASGPAWTHLRPGAFAANARQWAAQVRAGDTVRGPYADARTAPIHEADIAAVAARALLSDDQAGRAPVLSGPQSLSFAEQVGILGEALGRPLVYEEIPPEAARKAMVGAGMRADLADTLLRLYAGVVGRPAEISAETERITGRPARSFAAWAAEHAAEFR